MENTAMAEITAQLVKELREKSGVGMMDCKKALTETGGDLEAAMDWLRTKGLSKAAKKADRVAAEGLVAVALRDDGAGMTGAVVEVNAETDFVARNDTFQSAARAIARCALDVEGGVDTLAEAKVEGGETVSALLTNLIATIGENMTARRMARFVVPEGVVAAYVHNAAAPDLGRIGVLVALESSAGDKAKLTELGRKIGMHIAATSPLSLSTADIDPAAVERERAIFAEQAAQSGKPPGVVEKMVEGRIRKFYEEVVLLKQAFVMNPEQTIEQFVAEQAKALGAPVALTGFVRLALGEGVDKGKDDFAGEVAALTGGA
jgi:elongation factor Ts